MVIKHLFIFLLLFAKLNDKYSFGEDMLSWFYIHQICSIDLFHLYVKCRNEGVEAEGGGGGGECTKVVWHKSIDYIKHH